MIVQNRFPGCIAMVEPARALGVQQKIFVDEVHQLIQFPRVVDTERAKISRRESLTFTASTSTPSTSTPSTSTPSTSTPSPILPLGCRLDLQDGRQRPFSADPREPVNL